MAPIVARLESQGYAIRRVDVDTERQLADRFGITSIPAFVLVVDGREVTRIVGETTEDQLLRLLSQIPSDPPVSTRQPRAEDPSGERLATLTRDMANSADRSANPSRNGLLSTDTGGGSPSSPSSSPAAAETPPQNPARLLGRLFGRGRPADEAPPADPVVRGHLEGAPVETSPPLPVHNPVEASVRLYVTVAGQTSVGSGTAVFSQPGQTLIVTCGHLFEGWNDRSKIEVDLFPGADPDRFVGRLIHYDLEADVGLIAIPTDGLVPTARIPDAGLRPAIGASVVSIGCSGGAAPTTESLTISALNLYEGPDNVECTGVPVQGRSGGGLFDVQGNLVGVCIAADAERQRGVYAGLLAVHELLDACHMTDVYRTAPRRDEVQLAAASSQETPLSQAMPTSVPAGPAPGAVGLTNSSAGPFDPAGPGLAAGGFDPFAPLPSVSTAHAEVICIIRSREQPESPARVVVIERPSPEFLSVLEGESRLRSASIETQRPAAPASRPGGDSQAPWPDTSRFTRPEVLSSPPARPEAGFVRPRQTVLQPTALPQPQRPERYVRAPQTRVRSLPDQGKDSAIR
jgi:S1-C subfamily serine protease